MEVEQNNVESKECLSTFRDKKRALLQSPRTALPSSRLPSRKPNAFARSI